MAPPSTTSQSSTTTTAAPSTTTTIPSISGLGATLTAFKDAHEPRDKDYLGLPAFGVLVTTPEGPTDQFIGVQSAGGRVSQFIEVLTTGTSLTDAKSAVSTQLPPGWTSASFLVDLHGSTTDESCAFWNLTVPALARAYTGDPAVTIEMAYDNTGGAPYWKPTNVNTLTFELGHETATGTC